MAKGYNRRQRKKLRIGEFRELGFSVSSELRAPLDDQQRDALVDLFLAECIEANGMLFGGGINETLDGYVTADGNRSSATDRHREIVGSWIASRPEFSSADIAPLSDAWYPPEG